jgi:hypothetical protein
LSRDFSSAISRRQLGDLAALVDQLSGEAA